MSNSFGTLSTLSAGNQQLNYHRLRALEEAGLGSIDRLPYCIRVLLENLCRHEDGYVVTVDDIRRLANWQADGSGKTELPFKPARVILQDFTGVPAVVDLAALRSAMARMGGDPSKINPLVPVDLVIDHSVMVDHFGDDDAQAMNEKREFERNRERYEFLRWGQQAFENFSVVPPGRGIVHQINLEHLATCVAERDGMVFPDTLVGTDSHTTMINGLAVMGWGVGGIEAEAVMLGQPVYMLTPEVVGFEITGQLRPGVTATDMTLQVVQMLREHKVVGKFVEFYGDGVAAMSLADRATIANMAPEYGATMGFFAIDGATLDYLRLTGRDETHLARVEAYAKANDLWRDVNAQVPEYTSTLQLDLSTVVPSLAGPRRPQDRIALDGMRSAWQRMLTVPNGDGGLGVPAGEEGRQAEVSGMNHQLGHGDVVIAAITSCTNTSNPSVMVAAGLVAQKAAARGLTVKPWVKTSLAPGSRVVADYLDNAGLTEGLEALGFHVVGYGCTTCIGNSGPLADEIIAAIDEGNLAVASVLSGNRNFEGRISPNIRANFLASPPLVVAYAIAGTVNVDLHEGVLGVDADGNEVRLADIWPSAQEVRAVIQSSLSPDLFAKQYDGVGESNAQWNAIEVGAGQVYDWNGDSTYIQEPPFFVGLGPQPEPIQPIQGARALLKLGDSVTTDHISPAGAFKPDHPAGQWLTERGVEVRDFNSYGSRRGNDRVMTRGTFANVRIRNQLAPGTEGGWSVYEPGAEPRWVYDVAQQHKADGRPLIVLAGEQYGTGSSRDWAAKGTFLLGVKAVIASSYERIHRSNLVGMGVLPLQFHPGESHASLGLNGFETYDIAGLDDDLKPLQDLTIRATKADGSVVEFSAQVRIDTPVEVDYYRNGGILQTVLRQIAAS
ncbi:MAG: aconitate hydratase AcnA [Myxococcales bacterium]|nr:aconitate hydratase AcnA [Myxococcales bacterium]